MSFRYSLIAFITSGAGSSHKAAPGGAPKPRDQGEGDVIAYRPVFDFPFELRKTLGESGADHGQELWIVERNPSRRHHDDLGAVAFRLVEFVSRPIADLGHVAEILAGPVEVADGFEHSVIVEGVAPIAEQQLELEGLAPFLSALSISPRISLSMAQWGVSGRPAAWRSFGGLATGAFLPDSPFSYALRWPSHSGQIWPMWRRPWNALTLQVRHRPCSVLPCLLELALS